MYAIIAEGFGNELSSISWNWILLGYWWSAWSHCDEDAIPHESLLTINGPQMDTNEWQEALQSLFQMWCSIKRN